MPPNDMDDCIFCKIVRREIPGYEVYRDEQVLAFLDIHPIRTGHILVIPTEHVPNFYDLSEQPYQALMGVVRQLAQSVNQTLGPKKVGILVAGWDVPHTHVHLVPMEESNDLTSQQLLNNTRLSPSPDELAATAQRLRQ